MPLLRVRSSFLYASLVALLATATFPQGERATISGTVSDTSQSIIAGAHVTLRNVNTNISATAESNAAGIYVFPALNPGTYEVTFEKQGFRSRKVSGIPLSTGLTATIDSQSSIYRVFTDKTASPTDATKWQAASDSGDTYAACPANPTP